MPSAVTSRVHSLAAALASRIPIQNLESRLWSFGILCVAAVSFIPVAIATFALAAWYRIFVPKPESKTTDRIRTAIVTGGKMTKALATARILKKAGCRVVMGAPHSHCCSTYPLHTLAQPQLLVHAATVRTC